MNRSLALASCVVALVALTPPVQAEISFVNMFRSGGFIQNGDGNSLTTTGYFFSTSLTSANANDYTAVQMTYPGQGSPVNLTQTNPSLFTYQTGIYSTQAAMDADFPTGIYQFAASNTTGTDTTIFAYASDDYPQSLPYLTGTDYTDLQGANSAAPFDFHFSPYVTGSQANSSFLFFTIFDTTTSTQAYNAGFLSSTTTGLTLPANTLQPNHNYTYEVIFSNRDLVSSPGAVFDAQIGFDLRTQGNFTTAVPAPSGFAAFLIGVVPGVGMVLRRKRK